MSNPEFHKGERCPSCGDRDASGLADDDSDATVGWCSCGTIWITQYGELKLRSEKSGVLGISTSVYHQVNMVD